MKRHYCKFIIHGLVIFLLIFLDTCTIVDYHNGTIIYSTRSVRNEENITTFDEIFDPDQFVESIWATKAVPVFLEKAIDLQLLKSVIEADFTSALKQYGTVNNDKSGWVFVIKGSGRLLEVDRSSRNGIALLEIDSGNNSWTLQIQVGPVYKGMVLRDVLPFIDVNDYKNQIIFASISSAFNRKIDRDVVIPLAVDDETGNILNFIGVFLLQDGTEPWVITPAIMSIERILP